MYRMSPLGALFSDVEPSDGERAQARIDRRSGAMALLLLTAMVAVVTLVVTVAATQLIAVDLLGLG